MMPTKHITPPYLTAQIILGVLFLLGGISIYLLFRSETITLNQWFASLGMKETLGTNAGILRGNASKIIGVMIDSRAPDSMHGILAEIEQL